MLQSPGQLYIRIGKGSHIPLAVPASFAPVLHYVLGNGPFTLLCVCEQHLNPMITNPISLDVGSQRRRTVMSSVTLSTVVSP